jgi:hypothetical protein
MAQNDDGLKNLNGGHVTGGLFDTLDSERVCRKRRIEHALQTMRGHKLKVLTFFIAKGGWINSTEAMDAFTDRTSQWFIGPNYGRRMRELLEDGLLISDIDPDRPDKTHRWRTNNQ